MKKLGRPKKEKQDFKKCLKCKKIKAITDFYSTSSRCKPCHNEVVKKNQKRKNKYYNAYRSLYEKKHPEKRKAWQKTTLNNWEEKYGQPYKDFLKERRKKRLETDPKYSKHIKTLQNKYRLKNRDRILKKSRERYRNNLERERARARSYYHEHSEQQKKTQQIRRAKEYLTKAIEKNEGQKIKKYVAKLNLLLSQFEQFKKEKVANKQ